MVINYKVILLYKEILPNVFLCVCVFLIGTPVNIQQLCKGWQHYFQLGLSPSTRKAYQSGFRIYKEFCAKLNARVTPTSEITLILFVSHLANQHCSFSTIKVYLSAIRNAHVAKGQHVNFNQAYSPRLQQVMKGIQRKLAITKPKRIRYPITVTIMSQIQRLLAKKPNSYRNKMLWGACCLAYFGFLRSSEFTAPSRTSFDPGTHLSLADVAVDSRSSPKIISITIKQSKTDQLQQGHNIYLGRTGHNICPVKALMSYLAVRGSSPGALFVQKNGVALTRQSFSLELETIFRKLQLRYNGFNTHSFRIGAATTAKEAGISDLHIKMLGRWRSDAFQSYVRTSPHQLAKLSKQLIRNVQN